MSLHEDTAPIPGRRYGNLTYCGGGSVDVARYICEELHKAESRSVVITNTFADYGPVNWNSNQKYDSYVLITPSYFSQESDIVQSVESQLKQHSSYPGWNPRTRFVVIVTNISFKHNAEKLSQKILAELWKRKVINGIVLIPLTHASNSEVSLGIRKEADGPVVEGEELGIYTWFPFRRTNQCSDVDKAVLLDVWVMAGGGSFVRNSFLFPNKLSGNFHGCGLRVATALPPSRGTSTTQNSASRLLYTRSCAYEKRLLQLITRAINMTITFLPEVKNFRIMQDESGNFVGYTGLLMNDEADIALGGIMRTATSTILMDVTKSYLQVIWEWYVPCPAKFPGWKSIFRIFSATSWLSIFLSAVLAIIVIVFLARFGIKEYESLKRVVDAITDVWALMLGVSISPLPRTVPLRVFFAACVCCSLAINTVFQAYLTTFLVDPGFEKSITTIDEISSSGIKYGFISTYFDQKYYDKTNPSSLKILENRINCVDLATCAIWTVKYRNFSSISTSIFMDILYYNSEYSGELKDYPYCLLKETPVLVTDELMTLQKGSPFLNRMNEIIGRLTESGMATYLEKFNPETKSFKKTNPISSLALLDEYSPLNINNMQPAFFLFIFGNSLGLVSFLLEILYFKVYLQQH
jgi:hypothetical protein